VPLTEQQIIIPVQHLKYINSSPETYREITNLIIAVRSQSLIMGLFRVIRGLNPCISDWQWHG